MDKQPNQQAAHYRLTVNSSAIHERMKMFKLSKKTKERRAGIDRRLIEIGDLAIKITVVDFGYPADSGLRTPERQNELFKQGLSKADGYTNKSYHQSGNALDFYAYVDGGASWAPEYLAMVAAAHLQSASILGYGLEWGGLWKNFKDMPHLQLKE